MAVRGAQGGILHLCAGIRVGGYHHTGLAQLDVVQVQQVTVVGSSLHHIEHHAHGHHAAQHDAKAEHRSKGATDEPQDGVFALFLRRLGAFGCLGRAGTVFRCGACLAAALGNIDLTSHRAGWLLLAAPMDLSHLIVGDRDRLLTFQDCCRALLHRALSTSFVTRNFKLQYHIIARTPQPGKNQSLCAEQI